MQITMSKTPENIDEFSIRQLMPKDFTKTLRQRTGRAKAYISTVVKEERTSSPIWDAVLKLAEENKPKIIAEQQRLAALKSKAAA